MIERHAIQTLGHFEGDIIVDKDYKICVITPVKKIIR